MFKSTLKTLLFGLFFMLICLPKSKADCCPNDSLALLCIYLCYDGPAWANNFGWGTSAPLETWHGVVIETFGNEERVTQLLLPSNNLRGDTDPAFSNLTALRRVDLSGNTINNIPTMMDFQQLQYFNIANSGIEDIGLFPSIGVDTLLAKNNRFEFDDMQNVYFQVTSYAEISPQAKVNEPRDFFLNVGDGVILTATVGGFNNMYQWFKDGLPVSGMSSSPSFGISSVAQIHEGDYECRITNPSIPPLTLKRELIRIRLWDFDSLGGRFAPSQMIIEFKDSATQFDRDSLLDFYSAERLDVCMCGIIELWELPDTSFLPGGGIVIGVEETVADARQKAEVEEAGVNYFVELLSKESSNAFSAMTSYYKLEESMSIESGLPPLKVGIIDIGIDYNHPDLAAHFWSNNEPLNGEDDDENCLVDDRRGFNFANRNTDPDDDSASGHGTHVAGIVALGMPVGDLDLINLKSHYADGQGLLFDGLCGIYYARSEGARIINLSWGYEGEFSQVLENAIRRAGEDCGSLVVTSAGNSTKSNDFFPHYPSNIDLPNVISVAALNQLENDLATFSNYGVATVDLAAPGTNIFSTVPGGTFALKDGTSMAAGAVTRAAVLLMNAQPDATYLDVKKAILATVDVLPSLDSLITMGKLNTTEALAYIDTITMYDNNCLLVGLDPIPNNIFSGIHVYPQPSDGTVVIEFELLESKRGVFSIFDASGRTVYRSSDHFSQGLNRIIWDGKATGYAIPAGMFYFSIMAGDQQTGGKLLRF